MFIANSILVLIIAGPLIFGLALGFGLGRIGVSMLVELIKTLQVQVASVNKKLDEVKDTPIFPVVPKQPSPRFGP